MFLWIINIIIMNFIITISFLSIRKIIFYYKNICYFFKKNIYQKINLNKYFKKLNILKIFLLLAYIINLILSLTLIVIDSYNLKKEKSIDVSIAWIIQHIVTIIIISNLTIYVLWKSFKLKKKYNIFSNIDNASNLELYFLDINNLNLEDAKFNIVNEYIKNAKIKIYYNNFSAKLFPIIFPNYKKLKILLNKIPSFEEKNLYINSILATEPLRLRIKKEYLDREQLSYLHYLIINDIKKEL